MTTTIADTDMRFWRDADGSHYMINDETTHSAHITSDGHAHKWTPTPGQNIGRRLGTQDVPERIVQAAKMYCRT